MQCLPLARVAVGDIGHCQEHSILLATFAAIMITSPTWRPPRRCADCGEPMHGAAHWHARRVRQVPAESAVRGKPVATRLNKSRAWRTAIYALEKLMQGVDALATGVGRAQERLGHGFAARHLFPFDDTTWGRGCSDRVIRAAETVAPLANREQGPGHVLRLVFMPGSLSTRLK